MEVDYELTMADLLALAEYQSAHSATIQRQRRRIRLLLPVIFAMIWLMLWLATGDNTLALYVGIAVAVVGLIFFLSFPALVKAQTLRFIRRLRMEESNAALFRRRRLTITPETITEATEVHVSTWRWIAFECIVVERQHAFFFGALSALVLPKAAFATDKAFQEFAATAQRYHREALAVVDPFAPGGQGFRM
jgi:hypothetical protein